MTSDVSDVFMQEDDFASALTRYRNRDLQQGVDFVGIVTLTDHAMTDQFGKGTTQRATLVCASSVDIRQQDSIKHGDVTFGVVSVSDPQYGMITAELERYSGELRGRREMRNGDI